MEVFAAISATTSLITKGSKLVQAVTAVIEAVRDAAQEAETARHEIKLTTSLLDQFKTNLESISASSTSLLKPAFFQIVQSSNQECHSIFTDLAELLSKVYPSILETVDEDSEQSRRSQWSRLQWPLSRRQVQGYQLRLRKSRDEIMLHITLISNTIHTQRLKEEKAQGKSMAKLRYQISKNKLEAAMLRSKEAKYTLKHFEQEDQVEKKPLQHHDTLGAQSDISAMVDNYLCQEKESMPQERQIKDSSGSRTQPYLHKPANGGANSSQAGFEQKDLSHYEASNLRSNGRPEQQADMRGSRSDVLAFTAEEAAEVTAGNPADASHREIARNQLQDSESPVTGSRQPATNFANSEENHTSNSRSKPGEVKAQAKAQAGTGSDETLPFPRPRRSLFRRWAQKVEEQAVSKGSSQSNSSVNLGSYFAVMISQGLNQWHSSAIRLAEEEMDTIITHFRTRGKLVWQYLSRIGPEQVLHLESACEAVASDHTQSWTMVAIAIHPKRARGDDIRSIQVVINCNQRFDEPHMMPHEWPAMEYPENRHTHQANGPDARADSREKPMTGMVPPRQRWKNAGPNVRNQSKHSPGDQEAIRTSSNRNIIIRRPTQSLEAEASSDENATLSEMPSHQSQTSSDEPIGKRFRARARVPSEKSGNPTLGESSSQTDDRADADSRLAEIDASQMQANQKEIDPSNLPIVLYEADSSRSELESQKKLKNKTKKVYFSNILDKIRPQNHSWTASAAPRAAVYHRSHMPHPGPTTMIIHPSRDYAKQQKISKTSKKKRIQGVANHSKGLITWPRKNEQPSRSHPGEDSHETRQSAKYIRNWQAGIERDAESAEHKASKRGESGEDAQDHHDDAVSRQSIANSAVTSQIGDAMRIYTNVSVSELELDSDDGET